MNERERGKQIDRQTETHRERHTDRDTETERQTESVSMLSRYRYGIGIVLRERRNLCRVEYYVKMTLIPSGVKRCEVPLFQCRVDKQS